MEIWIIGGLIVALMVYLSTKIKNEAKRAYEREDFVAEHFKITKPDGFIIPIKEDSEFAFEAYSKDFSEEDETQELNQCSATVRVIEGIENTPNSIQEDSETKVRISRKKLINKDLDKQFKLEIRVVPEYEEQYQDRIDLILESFVLK